MRVSLIAPRGIHKNIFPWGQELVADYLESQLPDITVSKTNLSADPELNAVFPSYNRLMGLTLNQMRHKAKQVFLGSADFISSYTSQVAAMGPDFITVAEANDMFKPRGKKAIIEKANIQFAELKKAFDAYLANLIRKEMIAAEGQPHIWGVTSYDHTIFNVLYLAQKISEHDPDASIILGGDYWDFHNARTLIGNISWVDGVIVGYGEQALHEVVSRVRGGEKVSEMAVKGLTNKTILANEDSPKSIFIKYQDIDKANKDGGTIQTMNVPDAYRSDAAGMPFKLVHTDLHRPNVYRLLTQRGCSFGGCRFCTQIDRMIHFPFSVQEVTRQLKEELERNPPTGPISISIDNDEMTGPDLLYLVDFFDNLPHELESVVFWYQIKLFNAKIAAGLSNSRNANKYKFQMNWESMNPKTLKFMSKGHDPLKAIEAAKSVLDAGAEFLSNYMCHFPKQDSKNVAQEADFLAKAFHLAVGRLTVFSYSANGRDMISGSPDRYEMNVTRNPASVWSKQTFGADLDISFWQYDWMPTKGASDRFDFWISTAYSNLFKRMISYKPTLLSAFNHIPLILVCIATGRPAYIKRAWVLFNVMRRSQQSTAFRLQANRLSRNLSIIGLMKKVDVLLDDDEIELLRESYWIITEQELLKRLERKMTRANAESLLRKHEKLGAILRVDNKLISVVNDPGYWIARQASKTVPAVNEESQLAVNFG